MIFSIRFLASGESTGIPKDTDLSSKFLDICTTLKLMNPSPSMEKVVLYLTSMNCGCSQYLPSLFSRVPFQTFEIHSSLSSLNPHLIQIQLNHRRVNPVRRSLTLQRDGSHGALNPMFAPKGIHLHPRCKQWGFLTG